MLRTLGQVFLLVDGVVDESLNDLRRYSRRLTARVVAFWSGVLVEDEQVTTFQFEEFSFL